MKQTQISSVFNLTSFHIIVNLRSVFQSNDKVTRPVKRSISNGGSDQPPKKGKQEGKTPVLKLFQHCSSIYRFV